MALRRLAVSNPAANTNSTLHTANNQYLMSIIAANKSSNTPSNIRVWVEPEGATGESQYAYIVYDLFLETSNSFETFRFAVNQNDVIKVRSSTASVSFQAYGLAQYDLNLGVGVSSYSAIPPEDPITGLIWVDSDATIVGSSAKPAYVWSTVDNDWLMISGSDVNTAGPYTWTGNHTFSASTTLSASTSIGNVSSQEIIYLDGVTSPIQTQINDKVGASSPTLTGIPNTPTPAFGNYSSQIANTAFVYDNASLFTNRNMVYNGAFQVHQRSASITGITTGGYYTADRWRQNIAGTVGTWTQTIENDAPTGSGFRKSLKLLCTSFDSPQQNENVFLEQRYEGVDLQRIKKGTALAEQLTVSFWVKSNVTGTYIVELLDNNNTRHTSKSYTINTADTWEKEIITFSADTIGQLTNDVNHSLSLILWMSAGVDFTSGSLANTWASVTTANRAVGQTNVAAVNNNYLQITGVQMEIGPTATPYEFKKYETDLIECQRYFNIIKANDISGTFYSTTAAILQVSLPVDMRASINATFPASYTNAIDQSQFGTKSPSSLVFISGNSFRGGWILATGMTTATVGTVAIWVGSNINLSADL